MDNLLGQISSKLSKSKVSNAANSPELKSGSFMISASRSSRSSVTRGFPDDSVVASSNNETDFDNGTEDDEEPTEVCKREDSETYAKRTITEIETCLGFRFQHGAPEEEAAETMNNDEIEKLSGHIEAALTSGLSFKDRFTSGPKRPSTLLPSETSVETSGDEETLASTSAVDDPDDPDDMEDDMHHAPIRRQQEQAPQERGQQGKVVKKQVGLQLAVGSHMEQGEWTSNGLWLKKDKSRDAIPTNLQQIPAEDLVKVKELGRGCFGSVWLAKWRGVEVALKELLNNGHDTNPVEVFNEAEKLASLRHPCVMGFYGIVTAPGSHATVAEYICHGSLRSGLQKIKKKGIQDKRLKAYIALQGSHGMEYLHLQYMVHFDLKCDNLLCDLRDLNKPVVKIGDLGLSKLKKGSFISGNMRGTLPWMAPELFPAVPGAVSGMATRKEAEDRVTEKVDVFSYGIVLWEIWTLGEQPYPTKSLQEIFAGVMTGTLRPDIPKDCDPAWSSLMQDCWHGNPRLRPSFTDIISRLEAMLQRWSQVPPPGAAAAPK
eukprot:jgi/Chrzof1/7294/Cz02g18050.t1